MPSILFYTLSCTDFYLFIEPSSIFQLSIVVTDNDLVGIIEHAVGPLNAVFQLVPVEDGLKSGPNCLLNRVDCARGALVHEVVANHRSKGLV